jgi:hypothetical protein
MVKIFSSNAMGQLLLMSASIRKVFMVVRLFSKDFKSIF